MTLTRDELKADLSLEQLKELVGLVEYDASRDPFPVTAMDAIVVVDGNLRVAVFNRAAERLFGVSAQEAMGNTVERFIPARLRHQHAAFMGAFASEDKPARHMTLRALAPGIDIQEGSTTRARRHCTGIAASTLPSAHA